METAACGVLHVPGVPGGHMGSWQRRIQPSASPVYRAALSEAQALCGAWAAKLGWVSPRSCWFGGLVKETPVRMEVDTWTEQGLSRPQTHLAHSPSGSPCVLHGVASHWPEESVHPLTPDCIALPT